MRRSDIDELAKIEAQLEETEAELKEVQRKLKPLEDKGRQNLDDDDTVELDARREREKGPRKKEEQYCASRKSA